MHVQLVYYVTAKHLQCFMRKTLQVLLLTIFDHTFVLEVLDAAGATIFRRVQQ